MSDQPVALISGASRGIGAATAHVFAQANYRLALVATNESALHDVASRLETPSMVIAGDLADLAFVESIVPTTLSQLGRIDVLVNNAAWREIGSMRRVKVDDWERTLRICLTAPAFLARDVAENMEQRRSGVILNVGSIMALQTAGISPAYVACKGALDALTYELASAYGPAGIRVVCVQPGAVDTDLSREMSQQDTSDEMRQFSEDMIMLQRWGRPEEIADTLLFLASERASYITGATLAVDGGWVRQHLPLSLKRRHYASDYP